MPTLAPNGDHESREMRYIRLWPDTWMVPAVGSATSWSRHAMERAVHGIRMNRRSTVFALLALVAAPLVSRAQPQGKVWRVGFLTQRRRPDSIDSDFIGAFPRGMRELGYVEGKNLVIEWRFDDRSRAPSRLGGRTGAG